MADEIIVANGSATAPPLDSKPEGTFPYVVAPAQSDPTDTITDMIAKVTGEWILILRAGERISLQDYRKIRKLCQTDRFTVYQFIFHIKLQNGELGRYEWLSNPGKYSQAQVNYSGYIPSIGIRLFKKNSVRKVLSFDNGILCLDLNDNALVSTCFDIRILAIENDMKSHQALGENEKWQIDKHRFLQAIEPFSEFSKDFELIGPGKIGYSLISEKDLPSLEAGLDLGFGQIEILKWMVHNLIEKGAYEKAISFSDKILDRLSESWEIFEIWHLKGIAFFHMIDLANAEKSMKKALKINGTDMITLSDLARVYIVSGKLSEAGMLWGEALSQHGLTPENKYIYNVIKQNDAQRAKISLLILCRDEEKYIGRALKSVQSLFDEIVAVDTGSKDKTVDILRENGVKIVSHTWNDNFAEARNHGLTQATGDYVFWMDADEYLTDKDRLSFLVFKNILPLTEKKGVVFDVQTLNGNYDITAKGIPPTTIIKRTALFPNLPEIRFSGKVFESVDSSLKKLNIPLLFAESISIKHHSRNDIFRCRRKIPSMEQSANDFGVENLFKGIQFWLDVGDTDKAVQWFERAIVKADGNSRYLSTICKLFDEFKHHKVIRSKPQIFRKLVSCYSTSYRIATLCADYLYGLKEYDAAINLLKKLVFPEGHLFSDVPASRDIQTNRLHFAIASLEQDNFENCDAALALLSGDDKMADAVRAVSFYKAIRMKELDVAISVLDQWIRERNIPIKGTINNFTDFIRLIADIAEVITKYGLIDAAGILIRSADYFATTIKKAI